eukprot:COSAG01_NODE_13315_length_1603_cov_1.217420_1_plen_470_part_10
MLPNAGLANGSSLLLLLLLLLAGNPAAAQCDTDLCGAHGNCSSSATAQHCADSTDIPYTPAYTTCSLPGLHAGCDHFHPARGSYLRPRPWSHQHYVEGSAEPPQSYTCADFAPGGSYGGCPSALMGACANCRVGRYNSAAENPADHCPVACGANQGCCQCDEGWSGLRCEVPLSDTPGTCDQAVPGWVGSRFCGDHGTCVGSAAACADEPGWSMTLTPRDQIEHHPGVSAPTPCVDTTTKTCTTTTYTCASFAPGASPGPSGCHHLWTCDEHERLEQLCRPATQYRGPNYGTAADHCHTTCGSEGCCQCEQGWRGLRCEFSTDPCSADAEHPATCGEHGTCDSACVVGSSGCQACVCEYGWSDCSRTEANSHTRDNGTSICPEGTDVDQAASIKVVFDSLALLQASCVACPFADRCAGIQNCTAHGAGNLCASCVQGYYNLMGKCALCASKIQIAIICAVVLLVGIGAIW